MAGRPKTRAKKAARGECICPARGCPQHSAEDSSAPESPQKGASADRMRELTEMRLEMAKTDPSKKGGRPRTRFSKREAEEIALQRMLPKALRVLEEQLDDEDQRVRQKAAVEVIDRVKGKAAQTIKQDVSVRAIRYEAAALVYPDVEDVKELAETSLPEIPA